MYFKVYLCDRNLGSNNCIASFLDFTTLQCCVPSICLMLHQQGYKSQDLNITFFEGFDFNSSYTFKLSDFKATKYWIHHIMTDLSKHFNNLSQDRI